VHALGDTEPCLIPLAALEAGIAGTALKEIDKGPLQVRQNLLQELGIDLPQPRGLWVILECGETGRKLFGRERLARLPIVLQPLLQGPIPHPAAGPRKLPQALGLRDGGFQAKPVDTLHGVGFHVSILVPRSYFTLLARHALPAATAARRAQRDPIRPTAKAVRFLGLLP
jgi:hypothetical protein